ncbi:cytochrome c-type biogenesis protein CcmH [Hyphococcus flavus]|uniref:Cytochrome c-type biogenesis protein n=1 Tax=Hyphococcus flavus TaxID=1866326 RepID=A0AAE9ZD19_9PROT|nr:cytochrome c-type biogenesis protein [Hyphococcus flavus]WDI31310.1 cytochrome c-type biogenesis protein CcmH [Hyphococcus flavus]
MRAVFISFISIFMTVVAFAAEPDEMLDDPQLEERAQAIETQLRCVVCQSQSIAESNAPLAKDMRILVRERLTAGDTDEEAMQFLVDRYGDYVLMKPPFQANTLVLWFFPALALMLAGGAAFFYLRNMKQASASSSSSLSEDDEEKLQRIINERSQ